MEDNSGIVRIPLKEISADVFALITAFIYTSEVTVRSWGFDNYKRTCAQIYLEFASEVFHDKKSRKVVIWLRQSVRLSVPLIVLIFPAVSFF